MRSVILLLFAFPLVAQVTPFERTKAAALLRDRLPCLGCHELDGDGGRTAPSLSTVAQRRSASYIRAIIEDPQRIVPGSGMPKTPMPPAMRELVIRYIARGSISPSTYPARVTREPAEHSVKGVSPESAGNLYQRWCASCHGSSGGGDGPNAKFLPVPPAVHRDPTRMSARSDDALFDAIAGGGSVMGKSARMPAFGATLSSGEIRSLVAYIRERCACAGPGWSRDGNRR